MDWDKLRVFHAVAEAGSFTHAGETLNLSQSAVSRQISALEENLQVPLFHRHARGLILTEQGESLNRTVREVFAKLAMTEALLTESKEKPAGRLKVTTTVGFGTPGWRRGCASSSSLSRHHHVAAAGRQRAGPGDARGRRGDPHARAEAARPGAAPPLPDPVDRVAAPEYISARRAAAPRGPGRPPADPVRRLPSAGAGHQLAGRGRPAPRLAPAGAAGGEQPLCHGAAIKLGLGIGALPNWMDDENSGLVQLLPELKAPKVDVFFVYPGRTSKLQARRRVPRLPAGPAAGAALTCAAIEKARSWRRRC